MLSKQILGLNDRELSQFYLKSKFDYNLQINQEDFLEQYACVKTSPIVTWVLDIVSGFSRRDMNIDETQEQNLERKLSCVIEEKL